MGGLSGLLKQKYWPDLEYSMEALDTGYGLPLSPSLFFVLFFVVLNIYLQLWTPGLGLFQA